MHFECRMKETNKSTQKPNVQWNQIALATINKINAIISVRANGCYSFRTVTHASESLHSQAGLKTFVQRMRGDCHHRYKLYIPYIVHKLLSAVCTEVLQWFSYSLDWNYICHLLKTKQDRKMQTNQITHVPISPNLLTEKAEQKKNAE